MSAMSAISMPTTPTTPTTPISDALKQYLAELTEFVKKPRGALPPSLEAIVGAQLIKEAGKFVDEVTGINALRALLYQLMEQGEVALAFSPAECRAAFAAATAREQSAAIPSPYAEGLKDILAHPCAKNMSLKVATSLTTGDIAKKFFSGAPQFLTIAEVQEVIEFIQSDKCELPAYYMHPLTAALYTHLVAIASARESVREREEKEAARASWLPHADELPAPAPPAKKRKERKERKASSKQPCMPPYVEFGSLVYSSSVRTAFRSVKCLINRGMKHHPSSPGGGEKNDLVYVLGQYSVFKRKFEWLSPIAEQARYCTDSGHYHNALLDAFKELVREGIVVLKCEGEWPARCFAAEEAEEAGEAGELPLREEEAPPTPPHRVPDWAGPEFMSREPVD